MDRLEAQRRMDFMFNDPNGFGVNELREEQMGEKINYNIKSGVQNRPVFSAFWAAWCFASSSSSSCIAWNLSSATTSRLQVGKDHGALRRRRATPPPAKALGGGGLPSGSDAGAFNGSFSLGFNGEESDALWIWLRPSIGHEEHTKRRWMPPRNK